MKEVKVIQNRDRNEYKRILEKLGELVKALYQDIYVDICHCDEPRTSEYNKEYLTIQLWGSTKEYDFVFTEQDKAFGKTFCNDALIKPQEGEDFVQFKDGDLVLAEYNKEMNVLSFLYDVAELQTAEELEVFVTLLNMFIEYKFGSLEKYKEEIEKVEEKEREESIKKAVENILEETKRNKVSIERKIADMKNSIESYMNEIKKKNALVMSYKLQLNGINSGFDEIKEKIRKEIDAMKGNKKVTTIFFNENGELVFDTVELIAKVKCEDNKVRKYRMGRFRITVKLGNGEVKFYNKDIKNVRYGWWAINQHPHVSTNGTACLGSASTLILECISNREWAVLADVLINFLESVNIKDGAGQKYVNWDELDEDGNVITGERKYNNGNISSDSNNRAVQEQYIDKIKNGFYVAGLKYEEVM